MTGEFWVVKTKLGGLAITAGKILCLFVGLIGAFILGIFACPGSECDEWKVDCNLSIFVSSYCSNTLPAIKSIDIVYIYELPESQQNFFSICKPFGMEIKIIKDKETIMALATALQLEDYVLNDLRYLTGPTYHILFIDNENKKFGHVACTLGDTGLKKYAYIRRPGGFSSSSKEAVGRLKELGIIR